MVVYTWKQKAIFDVNQLKMILKTFLIGFTANLPVFYEKQLLQTNVYRVSIRKAMNLIAFGMTQPWIEPRSTASSM